MRIDWDLRVSMDDSILLRADVFRSDTDGQYPVTMTHSPFRKGLHFQDGYAAVWADPNGGTSRRARGSDQL